MTKLKVFLINLKGQLGKEVDLFKTLSLLKKESYDVTYNSFFPPGSLDVRMENRMTIRITKNGKILVYGAKSIKKANESFKEIKKLLRPCYVKA